MLERAVEKGTFKQIAVIPCSSVAAQDIQSSTYTDLSLYPSANLYRLSIVGHDQSRIYSAVVKVAFSEAADFKIIRNGQDLTVQYNGKSGFTVQLFTATGQVAYTAQAVGSSTRIPAGGLPAGVYYLVLTDGIKRYVQSVAIGQ